MAFPLPSWPWAPACSSLCFLKDFVEEGRRTVLRVQGSWRRLQPGNVVEPVPTQTRSWVLGSEQKWTCDSQLSGVPVLLALIWDPGALEPALVNQKEARLVFIL